MTQRSDWDAVTQGGGRGSGDQVIYYRRPRKGNQAGWIIWGDSLSGSKLRDFLRRGFEPLMKYGAINSVGRNRKLFGDSTNPVEEGYRRDQYVWEGILSHPDGPAEFPVEQIVTYRWYRPEQCPIPDVVFPQLKGLKVKEYNCPERCGRQPFVDVDGVGGVGALRQHLRIIHDWDQANLQSYGERVGIDFNRLDVLAMPVNEYTTPEPGFRCEECGAEFSKKIALAGHRRSHPVVEVETVA